MKRILILLYFILFTNYLSAEIIKKIDISGNNRVSDETVKVYGDFSINQNIDNIKINEIIKNLYSTNFFEDIKVSVSNNTLFVKLIEYPIINELIIVGESANKFKEQIKKQIQSKKNGPFIKSLISDDETTIKKLYSSLGFNFLEVKSKVEKVSSNFSKETDKLFPDSFVDSKMNKIPKGWRTGQLSDLISYISKGISPKYTDDQNFPVINQKCIRNGDIK